MARIMGEKREEKEMKIDLTSQRSEFVLFLPSNMAAMQPSISIYGSFVTGKTR